MNRLISKTALLLSSTGNCSLSNVRLISNLHSNFFKSVSLSNFLVVNSQKNKLFLCKQFSRNYNQNIRTKAINDKNKASLYYLTGGTALVAGFTYLSVLLYRLYCQTTGKGGQAVMEEASEKIAQMVPLKDRKITVNFNADVNSAMKWNFKPQQPYITVSPGETALAFYTARNPTSTPVIGVATYNVIPFEAGKYFNKIQCFCFEEQQLNPNEEVDMPVFFFLDPAYVEDPRLEYANDIVLSYTFYEAKEGIQLPRPAFV